MLSYIIQVIVCQSLFLIIFERYLKKETFFTANRFYLIGAQLLALVIPLIKLDPFKQIVPAEYIMRLPAVVLGNTENTASQVVANDMVPITPSIWSLELFLLIGMGISFLIFCHKFYKIAQFVNKGERRQQYPLQIIQLPNSTMAFSFLKYVFVGDQIEEDAKHIIIEHEKIHVLQKHTYDLLFFEILKVIMWFNPLVYLYQKRLKVMHEFIVDAEVIKRDKGSLYQNLLAQVFDTNDIIFTNTFFKKSLIKKRIIMLRKTKSKKNNVLKYLLVIPLIYGMLLFSACNDVMGQDDTAMNEEASSKTPLIEKIDVVKEQIQIQGIVNDHEQEGLNLLLAAVKGKEFDPKLVEEVHAYEATKGKSKLTKKIADVFEQIQIQGNINDEEEKTIKSLLVLTTEDGLNDPFFEDVLERVEIPFAIIEQPPSYPECESLEGDAKRKCFTNAVAKFVNLNFNIKIAEDLQLKGKQRIITVFKIDKEGNVTEVKARAPHPDLAEEAKRVVGLLPKMIPAKHKGKNVVVPYSLPILFDIKDDENKSKN